MQVEISGNKWVVTLPLKTNVSVQWFVGTWEESVSFPVINWGRRGKGSCLVKHKYYFIETKWAEGARAQLVSDPCLFFSFLFSCNSDPNLPWWFVFFCNWMLIIPVETDTRGNALFRKCDCCLIKVHCLVPLVSWLIWKMNLFRNMFHYPYLTRGIFIDSCAIFLNVIF